MSHILESRIVAQIGEQDNSFYHTTWRAGRVDWFVFFALNKGCDFDSEVQGSIAEPPPHTRREVVTPYSFSSLLTIHTPLRSIIATGVTADVCTR